MSCTVLISAAAIVIPLDLRIIPPKSGFVLQHMGLTADRRVTQCKADPGSGCARTAGVPERERAWCLRM